MAGFSHSKGGQRTIEESKNIDSSNTESKAESTLLKPLNLKALLDSLPTPPPQGWERVKLGDIGKICMCKRIMKHETNQEQGIPFYKIGTFGGKADSYITQELYEEYKAKYPHPRKGEILISAAGTIGKTIIYDGKPAYFQDSNIVWIDNNEKLALNIFIYYYCQNIDWMVNSTSGGTIQRLYNDDLRAIQIPLPPLESQEQIINAISKIEEKISLMDSSLEGLEGKKSKILKSALEST